MRIAAQAAPPEAVAQHDGVGFTGLNGAAHGDRHPGDGEEIVGDAHREEAAGDFAITPVDFAFLVLADQSVEDASVAEKAVGVHLDGTVAAHANGRERLRIAHGRTAEQYLVRDAEDCRVHADAQRQASDGGGSEGGVAGEDRPA